MEMPQSNNIPVNVFVERGKKPNDIKPAVEAAGLQDASIQGRLRIIFGYVVSRDLIPHIGEVPGVEAALEDVKIYPLLESQ